MSLQLNSGLYFDILPEEITEQILSLCVTAPFEPPPPRPVWLKPTTPNSEPEQSSAGAFLCSPTALPRPSNPVASVPQRRVSPAPRTRLAPLLVSRKF